MKNPITVRDLSGHHLGQRITITTEHTTAGGVLQGFRHHADAINMTNMARPDWVAGQRSTTITLMPNQDIVAELGDVVVVHDLEPDTKPRFESAALKIINDNPEVFHGPSDPRTVVIVHDITKFKLQGRDYIIYGRAITGRPILKATVMEAPRNDAEQEWLDTYLPAYITPEGEIAHAYKEGTSGAGD